VYSNYGIILKFHKGILKFAGSTIQRLHSSLKDNTIFERVFSIPSFHLCIHFLLRHRTQGVGFGRQDNIGKDQVVQCVSLFDIKIAIKLPKISQRKVELNAGNVNCENILMFFYAGSAYKYRIFIIRIELYNATIYYANKSLSERTYFVVFMINNNLSVFNNTPFTSNFFFLYPSIKSILSSDTRFPSLST